MGPGNVAYGGPMGGGSFHVMTTTAPFGGPMGSHQFTMSTAGSPMGGGPVQNFTYGGPMGDVPFGGR